MHALKGCQMGHYDQGRPQTFFIGGGGGCGVKICRRAIMCADNKMKQNNAPKGGGGTRLLLAVLHVYHTNIILLLNVCKSDHTIISYFPPFGVRLLRFVNPKRLKFHCFYKELRNHWYFESITRLKPFQTAKEVTGFSSCKEWNFNLFRDRNFQ